MSEGWFQGSASVLFSCFFLLASLAFLVRFWSHLWLLALSARSSFGLSTALSWMSMSKMPYHNMHSCPEPAMMAVTRFLNTASQLGHLLLALGAAIHLSPHHQLRP